MTMKTSAAGRKFIEKEEGTKLVAYQDSVKVWTIGTGHTTAAGPPTVTPGLRITAEEADEIFERDLTKYENHVNAAVKVEITQNQFDAMVSLCYNIGGGGFRGSSVVTKLNAGDVKGAADAFLNWSRAGNNPTLLKARRTRERALFLSSSVSTQKVKKAAGKAVKAVKKAPVVTTAGAVAATTAGGTFLSNIQSWHAVAALAIVLVAAGIGFLVWKKMQDA